MVQVSLFKKCRLLHTNRSLQPTLIPVLTQVNIKAHLMNLDKEKALAHAIGKMVLHTVEDGMMVLDMVKVNLRLQMVHSLKVHIIVISSMVLGNSLKRMEM